MGGKRITLNVLADIERKTSKTDDYPSPDKALLAFTGSDLEMEERSEELSRLRDKQLHFSLAFSQAGEKILDTERLIDSLTPLQVYREEDLDRLPQICEDYSFAVCANITVNTLAKVSTGMADNLIANIIWSFLYRGKSVYMDFSAVRNYLGAATHNKKMAEICEGHIREVIKMGAVEIEPGKYGEKIIGAGDASLSLAKTAINNKFAKVITEKDIVNYNSRQPLSLPRGTIVTHLARDKARALGIKIEIQK